MDLIEKHAVAPAIILLTWLGSFEQRMRNKVSKDLLNQHKEDSERRLARGIQRFDKHDKLFEKFGDIQINQGKTLVKIYTIVERMEKNNGGSK